MPGVMERLFQLMSEKKASDLYLSPGSPVHAKINGVTVPVGSQKLDPKSIHQMLSEVVTDAQWQRFAQTRELNFGHGATGIGSFRLSVFQQRGSVSAVIRFIPYEVPRFDSLGLPSVLLDLSTLKRGLVLVVGATGSGKSTTLASMIEHRNEQRSGHILTLEDPIEFTYRSKRSIVNQREIGTDTDSLEVALRNALRQAPDCIMIGEIRDANTMSAAIAYAQSGHLVLATLHANNSYHCLNRIVSFYDPEHRNALLADLSATLKGIVAQRLLRANDGGRIPAVEILVNTTYIGELIESGQMGEVKEAMEKSLAPGSQTFDQSLVQLVRERRVRKEDAIANADSATNLLWLLENTDLSTASLNTGPAGLPNVPGLPEMPVPPAQDVAATPRPSGNGGSAAPPAPNAAAGRREDAPSEGAASFSDFLLNI